MRLGGGMPYRRGVGSRWGGTGGRGAGRTLGLRRPSLAEQSRAGDGFQRSLVPRSRFQPRLTRGVRLHASTHEKEPRRRYRVSVDQTKNLQKRRGL
jgi:hypothetical protein